MHMKKYITGDDRENIVNKLESKFKGVVIYAWLSRI